MDPEQGHDQCPLPTHPHSLERKKMPDPKELLADTISTLKQQRDELALKVHLGSMESKEEWDKVSKKFDQLADNFEPAKTAAEESAGEVWESLKLVAEEVKNGFERIRKSL